MSQSFDGTILVIKLSELGLAMYDFNVDSCDDQTKDTVYLPALTGFLRSEVEALPSCIDQLPIAPKPESSVDIEIFDVQLESSDDDDVTYVCPLDLGIEDIYGEMHTLIPRQTQFEPIFTNAYAYQTTATIRIFQGQHNLTKYNVYNFINLIFSNLLHCRHYWASLIFVI